MWYTIYNGNTSSIFFLIFNQELFSFATVTSTTVAYAEVEEANVDQEIDVN